MNNTIGFSIVVANYNCGRFLEDALLSVIRQDYPKYQLIVIDGGSTDNSVLSVNIPSAHEMLDEKCIVTPKDMANVITDFVKRNSNEDYIAINAIAHNEKVMNMFYNLIN